MQKLVRLDYGSKLYLAYSLSLGEIKFFSSKIYRKLSESKYNKHKFIGKKIKRRNTKKETTYGRYKSIMNSLTDIRGMKQVNNFIPSIINDEYSIEQGNLFLKLIKEEINYD